MNLIIRNGLVASAVALALTGCFEKDAAYETVERDAKEISKSQIDTDRVYVYVPSTGDVPRFTEEVRPFFTGQPKLVKFRFVEGGLEIVQLDDDDRLDANGNIVPGRYNAGTNPNLLRPVLLIPGDYRDYQCKEDSFGECTNFEEIKPKEDFPDPDNAWKQMRYFVPNYKELVTYEVANGGEWFASKYLTQKAGPDGITLNDAFSDDGFELTDHSLNFSILKTYSVSDEQTINYTPPNEWDNLSFTAEFFYSFVALEEVASKDYLPIHYQPAEHNRFGFFRQELEYADTSGDSYFGSERTSLLQRFNPNKDSITYYLSDNFFTDENKPFLDETYKAIDAINAQLGTVGVPQIKLARAHGKHVGDIRYNFINLIDDPQSSGLLGYGPSVAHPLTGEILSAYVNQYSGVARATSIHTWNKAAELYNNGRFADQNALAQPRFASASAEAVFTADTPEAAPQVAKYASQVEASISNDFFLQPKARDERYDNLDKLFEEQPSLTNLEKDVIRQNKVRADWAKYNAMTADAVWVSATKKHFIRDLDPSDYLNKDGKLPRWVDLSEDDKKEIGDAISLQVYHSTLVHELGHNLGLRHNFMGSFDRDNFYSQSEVDQLNERAIFKAANLQSPPAYSSIMEYGRYIFDELPIFGKYDLAAFKFGYQRKLELAEGSNGEASKDLNLLPLDQLTHVLYDQDSPAKVPYSLRFGAIQFLNSLASDSSDLAEAITNVNTYTNQIAGYEAQLQNPNLGAGERAQIEQDLRETRVQLSDAQAQQKIFEDRIFGDEGILRELDRKQAQATAKIDSLNKQISEQGGSEELTKQLADARLQLDYWVAQEEKLRATMRSIVSDVDGRGNTITPFRQYYFCTDENSGTSELCNPFDEGTNIDEIVRFRIQSYIDNYEEFNFRNERKSFGIHRLYGYSLAIEDQFSKIRGVLEDYEQLSGNAGLSLAQLEEYAQTCTPAANNPCDLIRAYSAAAARAGQFFIDVVEEQDHYCEVVETDQLVANNNDPAAVNNQFKRLIPLALIYSYGDRDRFYPDATPLPRSCFDSQVTEYLSINGYPVGNFGATVKYTVVSETGRYLNSVEDNNPEFNTSADRGALGVWPDKVTAMRMLVTREALGANSYSIRGALADLPAVSTRLSQSINDWMLVLETDAQVKPDSTTNAQGQPATPFAPIVFGRQDQIEESYFQYYDFLRDGYGLNASGRTDLIKAYLSQIATWAGTEDENARLAGQQWVDLVGVYDETTDLEYLEPRRLVVPEWQTFTNADGSEEERVLHRDLYQALPENILADRLMNLTASIEYSAADISNVTYRMLYSEMPSTDAKGREVSSRARDMARLIFQQILRQGVTPQTTFTELKGIVLAQTNWQTLLLNQRFEEIVAQFMVVNDDSLSRVARILSGVNINSDRDDYLTPEELAQAWEAIEDQFYLQQNPDYSHPNSGRFSVGPVNSEVRELFARFEQRRGQNDSSRWTQMIGWADADRGEVLEYGRRLRLLAPLDR